MHVLVVHPSATMRRIVINVLRQMEHVDYSQAKDGAEGMEHLALVCSDLIVIAGHHSDMSSLEFVRAIRGTARTQHVRVLMISTNVTDLDILEASRAGVNGYVSAPLTANILKAQIHAALGKEHRQTAAGK